MGRIARTAETAPFRRCWRATELSDAVLYHGRYNHTFIRHSHDVLTFIVITDGAVCIEVDERSYRVEKGQFVAIGANQVHGARPAHHRGWRMRSLHLSPVALARRLGISVGEATHLNFRNPVHNGAQPIGSLFFDIHYCSQVDADIEARQDRFDGLIDCLVTNLDAFGPEVRPPDDDPQMSAAHRLLSRSLHKNLLVEDIAEEIGLSPFTLIRSFRRSFGISPHYWRMQARANAVSALLRDQCSLTDAAYSCGFSDQSHMARVFKKVFGVTPGRYRAIHAHSDGHRPVPRLR